METYRELADRLSFLPSSDLVIVWCAVNWLRLAVFLKHNAVGWAGLLLFLLVSATLN